MTDTTKTTKTSRSAVATVTEGDEGWPRPMYLTAACQLLGLKATVEEHGGRPFRIHLPHSQRIIRQIKDTAQRMQDSAEDPRVGATGEHPDGEVVEGDEGEMQFAVGAMKDEQLVVVSFGKAVSWLGMSAIDARTFADLLSKQADMLDEHAAAAAAVCTCGDAVGTFSRHESNPDGHGATCPLWGAPDDGADGTQA